MSDTPRTDAVLKRISVGATQIEFASKDDYEEFCFNELKKHAHELERNAKDLHDSAFDACKEFDRQSGRFCEAMGEENPRLLAVRDAIEKLKEVLAAYEKTSKL